MVAQGRGHRRAEERFSQQEEHQHGQPVAQNRQDEAHEDCAGPLAIGARHRTELTRNVRPPGLEPRGPEGQVPDRLAGKEHCIEHVDDDEALLAEATRVLRPDGLLLVSTPNRDLLDPGITIHDQPFNRYHTREYRQAEFGERLSRHFASVTWYGQRPFSPDYIAWLGRIGQRWPALAVKLHQARKCLGWPWESAEQHRPSQCNGDLGFTEVLIAACQTASDPDTDDIS